MKSPCIHVPTPDAKEAMMREAYAQGWTWVGQSLADALRNACHQDVYHWMIASVSQHYVLVNHASTNYAPVNSPRHFFEHLRRMEGRPT